MKVIKKHIGSTIESGLADGVCFIMELQNGKGKTIRFEIIEESDGIYVRSQDGPLSIKPIAANSIYVINEEA